MFFVILQAITAVVQKAMEYIDVTPDVDTRIELIKTLSSVAAGKVRIMATFDCLLLKDPLAFINSLLSIHCRYMWRLSEQD